MNAYFSVGKRILDVLVAGSALVVLSPVLLVVAVAIRLEDGGPVLFRQLRVGRNGRQFTILKFRSMPVSTPSVPSAQAGALRVTRTGAFIRRTNVDELPQLVNVLRGDMSIVGPRPALASQSQLLEMRRERGVDRLAPGLTGLAQVRSYDGMPEIEKVEWDRRYSENVSLATDLRIIAATFGYLLRRPPVY